MVDEKTFLQKIEEKIKGDKLVLIYPQDKDIYREIINNCSFIYDFHSVKITPNSSPINSIGYFYGLSVVIEEEDELHKIVREKIEFDEFIDIIKKQ